MKLKKLTLTNFRCYENFEIEFNEKLNVIVAENGAGKTTILDAIAIAYGAMLTRFPKVKGKTFETNDLKFDTNNKATPYMRIEAQSYSHLSWDRTQARNKTKQTKELIPKAKGLNQLHHYIDSIIDKEYESTKINYTIPLVMYYGTNRVVLKSPMRKRNFQQEFSRYEALTNSLEANSNFTRLFQWFDAMQNTENRKIVEYKDFGYKLAELDAVRNAITSVISDMKNPRIEESPLRFLIDRNVNGKNIFFRIDQLSDGYKTVLAMVMDISARMAEANPHLANSNESEALIMIDEIDLHLHPRWQQKIVMDLQKTFPNAQFILTTHSPQVLTTVEAQYIQALVLEENKTKIQLFNFSLGAKSHELLNTILGVDERPQNIEIVKILNRYIELVDDDLYHEEEAIKLRNELDIWGAGKEKELLRADMSIRAKEYRRKKYEKN